jgi:hypothetical protein
LCYLEEIQRRAHRRNTLTGVNDAPVAVVEDSTVADPVADMVPIDTTSQMTRGRRERAGSDRGIRNRHYLTRDDHPLGDDPGMDVRTMFEVGERLQDGNVRRYGDACDSLDLWDGEPVRAHDHRRSDLDRGLLAKALGNRAEAGVGNWDPAQGASGLEVDHARRKLPVGLAECRSVDHHAEAAWPPSCGDVGMRYAPEQTLAPGRIPV